MLDQILAYSKPRQHAIIGEMVKTRFFLPLTGEKTETCSNMRYLSVGLLTEQKGIDYLIQATSLLKQRGFEAFEIRIGGDGPELEKLRRMAGNLNVADKCNFLGMLTRHQVKAAMQSCDCFVLPSRHETFGVVMGAAMSCGKPVIATYCGGGEYVVTPSSGKLVNPGDPIALANAMESIARDKHAFSSERIRAEVQSRFGEEAYLNRMSEVYSALWEKSGTLRKGS